MTEDVISDQEISPTYPLQPDRTLAGEPLLLHIIDRGIDEDVEKAARRALNDAGVPIIAMRFSPDPAFRSTVNQWLTRQRRALAAWKAQEGFHDRHGRLSLRSRTATDADRGSDWLWAFVQWDPAKDKRG